MGVPADGVQQLAGDLARLVARLRALSGGSAAAACWGRAAARVLAAAALAAEGQPERPLPWVLDHALPDQVAVTGHDLVRALRQARGETAAEVAGAVRGELARLRQAFDPPTGFGLGQLSRSSTIAMP